MPGVNLRFNDIAFNNFAVVVLNLQAPRRAARLPVGASSGTSPEPARVSLVSTAASCG